MNQTRSQAPRKAHPHERISAIRRDVTAADKRLETLWLEPSRSGAPAIVMLHEGLGSIALWKHFPQQVAQRTGCGVLVYSRYGNGASERLAEKRGVGYMHHEAHSVLPELLAKLEIERPILLGHSDGGSIALLYAAAFPDSPRALVLEAPHVFVEELSVASIAQAKVNYQTTNFRHKLARYHAHVDATFWGWNDIWLDPAFRAWNIEDRLSSIRCPVLCIQGEQDEYGTRAQLEAIKLRVPGTEIVMLSECKHTPHRDQREKTLEAVAEFVGRVS